MKRTNKYSFFVRSHTESDRANQLFCDIPQYKEKDVVILQIEEIADRFLIFELIYLADYGNGSTGFRY